MLDTFSALATFDGEEKPETAVAEKPNEVASVDMSAIIRRINTIEAKLNELSAERTANTERTDDGADNSNNGNNTENESEDNSNGD